MRGRLAIASLIRLLQVLVVVGAVFVSGALPLLCAPLLSNTTSPQSRRDCVFGATGGGATTWTTTIFDATATNGVALAFDNVTFAAADNSNNGGGRFALQNLPNHSSVALRRCQLHVPMLFSSNVSDGGGGYLPSNLLPLHEFVLVVEDLVAVGAASCVTMVTQRLENATITMTGVLSDAQHVFVLAGHDVAADETKVLVGLVVDVRIALSLVRHSVHDAADGATALLAETSSVFIFNLRTMWNVNISCRDIVVVATGNLFRTRFLDVEAVQQAHVSYTLSNVSFTMLLYASEGRAFKGELLWVQATEYQGICMQLLHVVCRLECVNTHKTGCESGFLRVGGVIGQPERLMVVRGLFWLVVDQLRLTVLGTGATSLIDFDSADASAPGAAIRIDLLAATVHWTLKGPLDAVTQDTFPEFVSSISASSAQVARDGSVMNLARLFRAHAVAVDVRDSTFDTSIFVDANIAPAFATFNPLIFIMSFLLVISNVTDFNLSVTNVDVSSGLLQGPTPLGAFLSHASLVSVVLVLAAAVDMQRCSIRVLRSNFAVHANMTPATVSNAEASLLERVMGDVAGIAGVALQASLLSLDLSCCHAHGNFSVVVEAVTARYNIPEATARALRATGSGAWVGGVLLVGSMFQRLQLQGIRWSFVRLVIERSFRVANVGLRLSNMRMQLRSVRVHLEGSVGWVGLLSQYPRATDALGAVALFSGVVFETNATLEIVHTDMMTRLAMLPTVEVPNGCAPGAPLVGSGGAVGFSPLSGLQPAAAVSLFATQIGRGSDGRPGVPSFALLLSDVAWRHAVAGGGSSGWGLPLLLFNGSAIASGGSATFHVAHSAVDGVVRNGQRCSELQPWRLVRGSPAIHPDAYATWITTNVTIRTTASDSEGGGGGSTVEAAEGAALFDFLSVTAETPGVQVVATTAMLRVGVWCTTWNGAPIAVKHVGVKRTHLTDAATATEARMDGDCRPVDVSISRTLEATQSIAPPVHSNELHTTTAVRVATGVTVAVVLAGSLSTAGALSSSTVHLQSTVAALLIAARCQASGVDGAADPETAVGASFTDNPTVTTLPRFGPMLSHAGGAVLANMGLVCGTALLMSVASYLWDVQYTNVVVAAGGGGRTKAAAVCAPSRQRRWRALANGAMSTFPGSGAAAFGALLQSSVAASISLMMAPWCTAQTVAVGVFGLVVFVGASAGAAWYVLHDFPLTAHGRPAPRRPSARAAWHRRFWFYVDGVTQDRSEWRSRNTHPVPPPPPLQGQPCTSDGGAGQRQIRGHRLLQRLLPLFGSYRERNQWYFAFEHSVAVFSGLLSALSGDRSLCGACQWTLVALCCVSLAVAVWRTPCASTFENATLLVQNVLTLVIACLAASAASAKDAGAADNDGSGASIDAAAATLTVVQCSATLVALVAVALLVGCRRVLHTLCDRFVERKACRTTAQQFFAIVDARRHQVPTVQAALSALIAAICADRCASAAAARQRASCERQENTEAPIS